MILNIFEIFIFTLNLLYKLIYFILNIKYIYFLLLDIILLFKISLLNIDNKNINLLSIWIQNI